MTDSLRFAPSEALTLGIEEEFFLLDADVRATGLVPRADEVLNGDFQTVAVAGGWLKPELLRASVEISTATAHSVAQLDVDLRTLRDELARRAGAVGLRVAAMGTHPHHRIQSGDISPLPIHQSIGELLAHVNQRTWHTTHGVHVHVGLPNLDAAVAATNAVAAHIPLMIAITANSPYASGVRSTWMSARAEMLRLMQWAGPPPRFASTAEYEQVRVLHQLESDGDLRLLWEVAPVHTLGTIELRSVDANVDPAVALGIAALTQAIVARDLDGATPPRAHESIERHNRWSATEYGAHARFLVPERSAPVGVGDVLVEVIEQVRPWAAQLGSLPWLDQLRTLAAEPSGQRAVDAFEDGGMPAVLEQASLSTPQR